MSVAQHRRFRKSSPCPICGGYDQATRGKGIRCWGYVSDDNSQALCARKESAGPLPYNDKAQGYWHKLQGPCGCGPEHGPRPAPSKSSKSEWREPIQTVVYPIKDSTGQVVAEHIRREFVEGDKSFIWRRKGRNDLGGLKVVDLPLYGLGELLATSPGFPVVVVEGEKARDALAGRGILAVGTVTGAKTIPSDATLKPLLDYDARLWPDNDGDGQRHMNRIAARLRAMGRSPKMVSWLDAPPKGDAADFAGDDAALRALLEAAVPYTLAPPSSNGRKPADSQPQADAIEHYTDLGLARRLVALHGQDMRYCWPWAKWLVWGGQRWEPDDSGRVIALCKETVKTIYADASVAYGNASDAAARDDNDAALALKSKADGIWAWAIRSEGTARLAAAVDSARSEPGIPVRPEELDADPWVLNVQNGTLNLKTGQLRPHRREDLLTKMAPVEFAQDACLELWDRFLSDAIPDPDTRAYVQRCAGATLAGVQRDDLILLVHGPGGTGKSTFREALIGALGEYSATADLETFTTRTSAHGPQPDLARLAGKRLVAVSEVEGAGPVMSLLKRATGGDTLHARFLFGHTFQFDPQFTLWIVANERPRVPDNDTGLWRRLREIPFLTRFASPDPTIRQTLKTDPQARAAILAWAVKGCLAWQAQGVGQMPQQVQAATEEYQEDMDPMGDWLRDCAVEKRETATMGAKLWESYTTWCKSNTIKHPLGRKGFGQRLRARYEANHSDKGVMLLGVELLAEPTFQIQTDGSQPSVKANTPEVSQNGSLTGGLSGTNRQQPSAQLETESASEPSAEASQNHQRVSAHPSANVPGHAHAFSLLRCQAHGRFCVRCSCGEHGPQPFVE